MMGLNMTEERWMSQRTVERLRSHFIQLDTEKTAKIIRPTVRKFLVKSGRKNIPYSIQEQIFSEKYSWEFEEVINRVILNPKYYFDVLDNEHPFELLCKHIEQDDLDEVMKMMNILSPIPPIITLTLSL